MLSSLCRVILAAGGEQRRPLPECAYCRGRGAARTVSELWGWPPGLHPNAGLSIPGPSFCPSALPPAAWLPAPYLSCPLKWAGRGRSLSCCPLCCLRWDLASSTKPVHFSIMSEAVVLLARCG